MKTYLLFLFLVFNSCLAGKKNKKRKEKPCKESIKKELAEQRSIEFFAKNAENTIWPYEWSYIKATMEKSNIPCGIFQMRVVDLPLQRLINKNNEWQSMNSYDVAYGIGDIPTHLLLVRPRWFTRNIFYTRYIKAQLRIFCAINKAKKLRKKLNNDNDNDDDDENENENDGDNNEMARCVTENKDMYRIGPKAFGRSSKWNLEWSSSIFSRNSETYKLKINPKFIQNMHPGINGVGAINKISKIYTAYKSFLWLTKYLEINLNIKQRTNNIPLSIIPILHYSQYDNTKCGVVCEREFDDIHKGKYAFNHEFVKFVSMESSERLGRVRMEFKNKFVHSLGMNDAKIPNLIKKNKNIKLRLSLERLCGIGGYCANRWRAPFFMDGWDLFFGEQIEFQLNILQNRKDFKIITYQNPIISAIYGSNTVVFGKGMRKKSMTIKPTRKVQHGIKYKFEYKIITSGAWHKWYLYYFKMFESEKNDYLAQDIESRDGECETSNMYEARRPKYSHCEWGALKTTYKQEWYVEMPKPGYFKHSVIDQFRFANFFQIGETKCGSIEAKMEEWPADGKKFYIKLLLKYLGSEGGLVLEENVLRFPEVRDLSFRKYVKKWCVTARAPGTYAMVFEPYGSLLNLFPTPPSQLQINIQQARTFTIRIPKELKGVTVYNNEWSDTYKISISRFPDKDKQETDIILTPKCDDFQFSPTRFIWSANTAILQRRRTKSLKFRALFDCAFGGINVNIQWEITGMISRVRPYPIPYTKIRVTQHIAGDGCNTADDDDDVDEQFIPLQPDINEKAINLTDTTKMIKPKQPMAKKQESNKSEITFIFALILLCSFGLIIMMLCAFGCLGNDQEFELLVSTQLRKAMIDKQKQMLITNMNDSSIKSNIVDSHYSQNVNAKQRLIQQNHLFPS